MLKSAIVVLASTETHEGLGRAVNALQTAREMKKAGDDVKIIFDGAGAVAAATIADPENQSHKLYQMVEDRVAGVCSFCADAFGVKEQVESAGIPLLEDFNNHPSLRSEMAAGYQIVTF